MKQLKLTFLLTVFLSMMSNQAAAYDFEYDGLCYNIKSVEDLTCILTAGESKYYGDIVIPSEIVYQNRSLKVVGIDDSTFMQCERLSSVELPSTIQTIGEKAFEGCSYLKSIQLPDIVAFIGSYAFKDCISLSSIGLSSQLRSLEDGTFYSCTSISEIVIPHSIEKIGNNCFFGCIALSSIELSNAIMELGTSAFENCCQLKGIIIPLSLQLIQKRTFKGCSALKKITIPSGVIQIEDSCFMGCSNLSEVIIEDANTPIDFGYNTITSYSDYSDKRTPLFEDTKLKSLYLGRSLVRDYYGFSESQSPFSNLKSLSHIEIGPMVSYIGSHTFTNLPSVTELTIPSTVTRIGDMAFSGENIKKLYIEDGDAELVLDVMVNNWDVYCAHTFNGCPIEEIYYGRNIRFGGRSQNPGYPSTRSSFISSSLKKIIIGETVKQISPLLYSNEKLTTSLSQYPNLKSITFGSFLSFIPQLSENLLLEDIEMTSIEPQGTMEFSNSQYLNLKVSIPVGSKARYEKELNWKDFWNLQEKDGLIKSFEYEGLRYMIKSTNDVVVVKNHNPYNGNITVPPVVSFADSKYNVLSIGTAFRASSITHLTIPESISALDNYALYYCSSLKTVIVNGVVSNIGNYAFKECSSLEEIQLKNGLKHIGSYAFHGCEKIKKIELPNSTISIGSSAFMGCSELQQIILNEGLETIGDNIINECPKLHAITIPSTISIIPNNAFENCSNLTALIIKNGVKKIGEKAFRGCINLKSIDVPSSIRIIGEYAFQGCSSMINIELEHGIETIAAHSFDGCSSLAAIKIPPTVLTIGNLAFVGCSSLSEIEIEDGCESLTLGSYEESYSQLDSSTEKIMGNVIGRGLSAIHGLFYGIPLKKVYIGRNLVFPGYRRYHFIGAMDGRHYYIDYCYDSPFQSISTLKEVVIGANVNVLGRSAVKISDWKNKTFTIDQSLSFSECNNINTVKSRNTKAPQWVAFSENTYRNAKLFIPVGAKTSYAHTEGWNYFRNIIDRDKYTMTYMVDGQEYHTTEVEYGATITPEVEPTKEGYTFSGWSEIPETMPAQDVVVTGTFTINKYKVTFMYGDNVLTTIEVAYGEAIELPTSLNSERYKLVEWLDVPETMPARDIIIFADYVDGIDTITADSKEVQYIQMNGMYTNELKQGLNIIRMKDGTTKKVWVK